MRNIESGSRSKNEEQENSALSRYWKQYNFRGNPPKPGTLLEERLVKKCQEYTRFILDKALSGSIGEKRRHELHNEIALMVLGNRRDDMDYETAEKVSNFATIAAVGMTMDRALDYYEKNSQKHSDY